MKKIICIIVLSSTYLNGYSWGHEGHEIVAEIAKVYCPKAVQDSVNKYLDGLTWEKAATWMDDVRSDRSYDYMKSWHYLNVEKDKTYVAEPKAENCVVEIQKAASELADKSKLSHEQINMDLKLLFHLVGDEHMPLHVGYGEDKGGNTIEVDYFGKYVKLHHLWDTDILVAHMTDIQAGLTNLCKLTSKADIKKLQETTPVDWMNEGRTYLPQVYDFKRDIISKEYDEKAAKVIEKQIFEAGVRLAGILNATFKK